MFGRNKHTAEWKYAYTNTTSTLAKGSIVTYVKLSSPKSKAKLSLSIFDTIISLFLTMFLSQGDHYSSSEPTGQIKYLFCFISPHISCGVATITPFRRIHLIKSPSDALDINQISDLKGQTVFIDWVSLLLRTVMTESSASFFVPIS